VLPEEDRLRGKRISVDWRAITSPENYIDRSLDKFRVYLTDKGFRESTIEGYIGNVKRYLRFSNSDHPARENYNQFRELLYSSKLSRSTLNQYGYSIKAYHQMLGEDVEFSRMIPNNRLPYYFTNEDVYTIFSSINNIKHLAMLQTLFYGCLRASELCNLNDDDLDMKDLTLRINAGKGGNDGIACINNKCATTLRDYLQIRPTLSIKGKKPLFYTDYGNRWHRIDIHHMFCAYKKKAGIEKRGGLHVFARHTPATIMIANGCDIRIVQEVLRHKDIRTTLRYAHVSDKTKREKYEQYLTL
jgi:integrase/recombinase XerD